MKNVFALLCTLALMLGVSNLANAGGVAWTLLEDASLAGIGPGPDETMGTGDDTTSGEDNPCNFSGAVNCRDGGTPADGSYSFVKMDLVMDWSCADGANVGDTCTDTGHPAIDCGAGALIGCIECVTPTFSYLGSGTNVNGNGTMATCNSGSSFTYDVLKIGTSESVPGVGGGCLVLDAATPGDDGGSPCGVGTFTSSLDVDIKIALCLVEGGSVPNIAMTGKVFDLAAAIPTGNICGYTGGAGGTIATELASKAIALGGKYLMISCANQTLPTGLTTGCISGAGFVSKIVAYSKTAAATFDCAAACGGGGCMMGTAEEVE